jgi:hypothetical protein
MYCTVLALIDNNLYNWLLKSSLEILLELLVEILLELLVEILLELLVEILLEILLDFLLIVLLSNSIYTRLIIIFKFFIYIKNEFKFRKYME